MSDMIKTKSEDSLSIMDNSQNNTEYVETSIPKNLKFNSEETVFNPETVSLGLDLMVRPMSVEETKLFEAKINECIDQMFVEGIHYGNVPGIKKRFIFKAGCEIILSMMGLVARTEVVDKIEDYTNGVFSYTCKTWLIDRTGSVRAEGYGVCNSKENKYLKMNPFNIQNVLLKLSRKRSITDSVLSVSGLSNKFSQDEDLVEQERIPGRKVEEIGNNTHNNARVEKAATAKQIAFLENLIVERGTNVDSVNVFAREKFGVDDYHYLSSANISQIIEKLMSTKN